MPLFHNRVPWMARRRATTEAMQKHGLSRFEARRKLAEPTDDQINQIVQEKCQAFGVAIPETSGEGFGAIGDGSVIQAIKEFCDEHPEVVAAIVKALLLLVGL